MPGLDLHRISVIVIARNADRYIASALESIFASTRAPDEVIVVDGGSTDATRTIAKRFAGVRVAPQRGSGIAAAYNQGIEETSGNLVAFLSADDRWHPDKLALQEAALLQDPSTELVVCHVQHELEPGCNLPSGFRPQLLDAPVPGFIMECLLVHRRVFDRIGYFDPAFSVSEDTDWFVRARDRGVRTIILPQSLVSKRLHDRNASLNEPGINHLLLQTLRQSLARKRTPLPEG